MEILYQNILKYKVDKDQMSALKFLSSNSKYSNKESVKESLYETLEKSNKSDKEFEEMLNK